MAVISETEDVTGVIGGNRALNAGDFAQPQVRFHTRQTLAAKAVLLTGFRAQMCHRGEQVGNEFTGHFDA